MIFAKIQNLQEDDKKVLLLDTLNQLLCKLPEYRIRYHFTSLFHRKKWIQIYLILPIFKYQMRSDSIIWKHFLNGRNSKYDFIFFTFFSSPIGYWIVASEKELEKAYKCSNKTRNKWSLRKGRKGSHHLRNVKKPGSVNSLCDTLQYESSKRCNYFFYVYRTWDSNWRSKK